MDSHKNFSEDLLSLIKTGESNERVKEIIENSFLYHLVDSSGAGLLHYCARYNNVNITRYLLEKKCNVDIHDSSGFTPLMISVTENHMALINILIEAGADIFKVNNENKSVLHLMDSAWMHVVEILLQELQKRCSSSKELLDRLIACNVQLYNAIVLKDSEIIYRMISSGFSVNSAHPINKATAVYRSVSYQDLKSLRVLLEHGANMKALTESNNNTFYLFYHQDTRHTSENMEILKILLKEGVTATHSGNDGLFNGYFLLVKGNNEAIRILFESGLDWNAKDTSSNNNLLHYFAKNMNPGIVDELEIYSDQLESLLNSCNKQNRSPLSIASYEANVEMVKFLLKKGAKTDSELTEKENCIINTPPLYYAYSRGKSGLESEYHECGKLLLQANADAQVIILETSNQKFTILDPGLKNNDLERLKPIVDHLALIQKQGIAIIEIIQAKINSYKILKDYFTKCQEMMNEIMYGQVKLFDILTANKKKMARYLRNENIVKKLENKRFRSKMATHSYYYDVLTKLHSSGNSYKALKEKSAEAISQISRNRINETNIIIDMIIDYIDDDSLKKLCCMHSSMLDVPLFLCVSSKTSQLKKKHKMILRSACKMK